VGGFGIYLLILSCPAYCAAAPMGVAPSLKTPHYFASLKAHHRFSSLTRMIVYFVAQFAISYFEVNNPASLPKCMT